MGLVVLAAIIALSVCAYADASDRPCRPWVKGVLHYDVGDSDGNPRSNPDDTLYPGDAVRYEFDYGYHGTCYSFEVRPVRSHGGIMSEGTAAAGTAAALIPEINDCHGGGSRGALGYGGDAGWSRGHVRTDCGSLSMEVQAKERHCWHAWDGRRCTYVTRTAGDEVHPRTVPPVVEIGLMEHVLNDTYGYPAANADLTNYVWDPIAIEHMADFGHADAREGTISFRYDRDADGLVEEGGYECDRRCSGVLAVYGGDPGTAAGIGFAPYAWGSGNGGGMYAYAAPGIDDAGMHTITYDVAVLNEGRVINTHRNQTDQLVVVYDPVYAHYEYPVLADGAKYAYGDRLGVAIRYEGSVGSGPDDDGLIHAERRSRINHIVVDTVIRSEHAGVPPIGLADSAAGWDSIHHVRGTDHDMWGSTGAGHAMFHGAGYGIVRLSQDLSGVMGSGEHRVLYRNATTYGVFASDRWAGHDSYENWNYTYQYPHTPFAQWYNATSYDADGNVMPVDMSLSASVYGVTHESGDAIPYEPEGGADSVVVMLDHYMHEKTLHDTGDRILAAAVVDEMHGMANEASGVSPVGMWINKTGLEFPYGHGQGGILEMDPYLALDLDARMEVITMADGREIRRVMQLEFVDDAYHERFSLAGAPLHVERVEDRLGGTSLARIGIPDYFGAVHSVTVDGSRVDYGLECDPECDVIVAGAGNVTIRNVWGATAVAPVDAAARSLPRDPAGTLEDHRRFLLGAAALGLVGYAVYAAARRAWDASLAARA